MLSENLNLNSHSRRHTSSILKSSLEVESFQIVCRVNDLSTTAKTNKREKTQNNNQTSLATQNTFTTLFFWTWTSHIFRPSQAHIHDNDPSILPNRYSLLFQLLPNFSSAPLYCAPHQPNQLNPSHSISTYPFCSEVTLINGAESTTGGVNLQ